MSLAAAVVLLAAAGALFAYLLNDRAERARALRLPLPPSTLGLPGAFSGPAAACPPAAAPPPPTAAPVPPKVAHALARVRELVMRDFVEYWFPWSVSADLQFPNDSRAVMDAAFDRLAAAVQRVDWVSFVAQRLVTNLTDLLRIQRLCEQQLERKDPAFAALDDDAERTRRIEAEVLANYKLHVAATASDEGQREYLRRVSTALLSRLLRPSDYGCGAVRSLMREVFVNNLLFPAVQFVNPCYVNSGIASYFAAAEAAAGDAPAAAGEDERPLDAYDRKMDLDGRKKAWRKECTKRERVAAMRERMMSYARRGAVAAAGTGTPEATAAVAGGGEAAAAAGDPAATAAGEAAAAAAAAAASPPPSPPRAAPDVDIAVDRTLAAMEVADDGEEEAEAAGGDTAGGVGGGVGGGYRPWQVTILEAITMFDPKPYIAYKMKVSDSGVSWSVAKRYSEFTALHQELKRNVDNFDAQLPKKQLFGNMTADFVKARKAHLQRYLEKLMWNRTVMESEQFRIFLLPAADAEFTRETDEHSIMSASAEKSRSYSSVQILGRDAKGEAAAAAAEEREESGSDGEEGAGEDAGAEAEAEPWPAPPDDTNELRRRRPAAQDDSMLGKFRRKVGFGGGGKSKTLPPRAGRRLSISQPSSPRGAPDAPAATATATAAPAADPPQAPVPPAAKSAARWLEERHVTQPLYTLLEEVFHKSDRSALRNNVTWVGKQLLEVALDSKVNRLMSRSIRDLTQEEQMVRALEGLTALVWPDDVLVKPGPWPTDEAKEESRLACKEGLASAVPTSMAVMMGKRAAVKGLMRVYQFGQIHPLLLHFAYSSLDCLVVELFPELRKTMASASAADVS